VIDVRRVAEIAFLVVVPLAIFLLITEGVLRLYLTRNIFYDVEMSRYALTLKVDSPNPLIGHHHRPNALARLMGVDVRTNGDGFRDDELPVARTGKRRVVFLGDSLTLGWGVEKRDTFEHRLERALSETHPTEVINLGVGNYNTTQEVHLFLDKGLRYDPDQVVLFYFINDAEEVPQRSRFPGLGRTRVVTFFWSRIKALISQLSDAPGYREFYADLYREGSPGWARSREALALLRDVTRERDIDLRMVLLPELHELDPYAFEREYALVAEFASGLGIPVLDLAPAFRGEDPQSLWVSRDDAHPNARAHALIADYTRDFISQNGSRWSTSSRSTSGTSP
jgi:lysophospholipase L1-like esterase